MMKITIPSLADMPAAAAKFAEAMNGRTLFAFSAPMGAGKTTFISELVRTLGMEDEASSPTFSIINEYHAGDPGKYPRKIYHFDFYRLDSPEEALDLGLDDYFDSGLPCLMEWAENIGDLLPAETVNVTIEVLDDGTRILTLPD